ncbi:MAG: hypothetical protein H0W89_06530 [Candidatus Levybacteria bacterium]|nr:hypothetical protein [Candidatus Levybacteria bacterium]
MSKEVWVGKKDSRYWYYKYRDSEYFSIALTSLTVIGCLVLVFNVIIPQFAGWFSIREEIIATRARIAILESNINFMNNLDRNALNTQLDTATTALPTEKEFGPMLDALSAAAVSSGVSLNDFSFQVGNVASSSGQAADARHKDVAAIKITLVATGPIANVKKFISNLEKSIPVTEVVNIDGSNQTVSLSIQFYQKNVPQIDIQADKPLAPLSAEKTALIQDLAKWKRSQPLPNLDATAGSAGAIPLF